jgi:aldose 1-epimerase
MVAAASRVSRDRFGTLPDGREVERVVLRGAEGFEAHIIAFGATLQALIVPDAQGGCDDVVLGDDNLAGYVSQRRFFGATVGRYANRIANARFVLDGEAVHLAANDGPNALHGGVEGFDRKLWEIIELEDGNEPSVTLGYESHDGEEGYPGRLDVRLTYCLTGASELSFTFAARTDRPTIANLTNHSFFNLEGAARNVDVLDHRLMLASDYFLATDAAAIPVSGPPLAVAGTPFDFRKASPIGARIRCNHEQLLHGKGYDHNFCLRNTGKLQLAARLEAPRAGRVLELLTDQPGLQVYSGNYLDGSIAGKRGRLYRQSDAICLEPQIWPDAPNRPDFPTPYLVLGDTYRHHTIYRFSRLSRGAT